MKIMALKPILFTGPMVNAIFAGRKRQTRRLVTFEGYPKDDQPDPNSIKSATHCQDNLWKFTDQTNGDGNFAYAKSKCQAGDILWVRETYYAYGKWKKRISVEKQRLEWHFVDLTLEDGELALFYGYDATPELIPETVQKRRKEGVVGWWKRPALFMPYVACRLFLGVDEVRAQRLNKISSFDAIEEGILPMPKYGPQSFADYTPKVVPTHYALSPKFSYKTLWEKINGPGSWDVDPWVWAYNFQRTNKPA